MLDLSTLQTTIDIPGDAAPVTQLIIELSGVTQDANETTTGQFYDIAQSEPAP